MRKPQAFRHSQLRDDLLPSATYRGIWRAVDARLEARAACKYIVGVLALAARADCEQALGEHLDAELARGRLPELHTLQQRFAPSEEARVQAALEVDSVQHPLSVYDRLLPARAVEVC